jgi:hypothetical protein
VYVRSGGVWAQQGGELLGNDAVGNAMQGASVAISADGSTAIVGGPGDGGFTGTAWVYIRSGGVWTQQGSKLPNDGESFGGLGTSVSISADGNTAIVGEPHDGTGAHGASYVYKRSGGVWAKDGPRLIGTIINGSYEGTSVAVSGDGTTVIVGGPKGNNFQGAAWVYTRGALNWVQQGSVLVGTGAAGPAYQGSSVSLSADGNTALVGGYGDNNFSGAAWVFTRSGGVWSQQGAKLSSPGALGGANQGMSVSLSSDGNSAIIGAPADVGAGAARVYTRSNGVWSLLGTKLVGAGAVGMASQGTSVSLSSDGNTAIVGGPSDSSGIGAAWVFSISSSPGIVGVSDIPNDQGGKVGIRWGRSAFDNALTSPQVTSYSIWRALPGNLIPPSAPPSTGSNPSAPGKTYRQFAVDGANYYWEWIADQPALLWPEYGYAAPTLSDSTSPLNNGMTKFTVIAQTSVQNQFYASRVDSGYSVDNLAPIRPAGLTASVQPGPQVSLTWNPPTDPDVGTYTVYRSKTSGFTPAPGNKIGTSHSADFIDTSPLSGDRAYYRIIAVDVHDNESLPSTQTSAAITVSQQFSEQNNWNIVSVPMTVSDFTKTAVYPDAFSDAFAYNGAYVTAGTLTTGKGYWLKFNGAQNANLTGLLLTNDTLNVQEGWNMVGSLSQPIAVSSISSIPGGIVTSRFFGYQDGYVHADSIHPGQGYWVKVTGAGQLVLMSAGNTPSSSRIRIEDRSENPPPPPERVTSALPDAYRLEQNYPNPFNPTTTIRYSLPVSEHVKLSVYNLLGQQVATLVNETQEAGYKSISFDAGGLSSGMYTYRLSVGAFTWVKKLLLVK